MKHNKVYTGILDTKLTIFIILIILNTIIITINIINLIKK